MADSTFSAPDLTTFARLDTRGLQAPCVSACRWTLRLSAWNGSQATRRSKYLYSRPIVEVALIRLR